MSTPTLQDGHPSRANSTVSSPSQPGTPLSNMNGVQTKIAKSRHRASSAILGGTERLLALYEDELARVEAQHKKQIDDITARFDEFRYFAAQEQLKLVDRIYLLEAELAARGGDVVTGGSMPVHSGPDGQTNTMVDMEILDVETIHLVRGLARLVKSAELTTTRTPQGGIENLTLDTSYLPELFLPALAQYLASHKKALRDLQEKHRAVEREHDRRKETVPVVPFTLKPSMPRNNGPFAPGSVFIPSMQRPEVNQNSLLSAASSSLPIPGGILKRPRI